MRVGILAGKENSYARLLQDALTGMGCECAIIPPTRLMVGIPDGETFCSVTAAENKNERETLDLAQLDGLIVRSLPGGSLEQVVFRLDVLYHLEAMGVRVINGLRL